MILREWTYVGVNIIERVGDVGYIKKSPRRHEVSEAPDIGIEDLGIVAGILIISYVLFRVVVYCLMWGLHP